MRELRGDVLNTILCGFSILHQSWIGYFFIQSTWVSGFKSLRFWIRVRVIQRGGLNKFEHETPDIRISVIGALVQNGIPESYMSCVVHMQTLAGGQKKREMLFIPEQFYTKVHFLWYVQSSQEISCAFWGVHWSANWSGLLSQTEQWTVSLAEQGLQALSMSQLW